MQLHFTKVQQLLSNPPMPSYWRASARTEVPRCPRLSGEQFCEVAIIGGGYTGLSAALHLARDHGIQARVLEAHDIGWGASGRNGGFCCLGGAKLPAPQMIKRYGLNDTRRLLQAQQGAVELVRGLIQQERLTVSTAGQGELCLAHHPGRRKDLEEERDFLAGCLGLHSTVLSREELATRGYAGPEFHAGLDNPLGFGLHPLEYAQGLAAAALRYGAAIYTHSPVTGWERSGSQHRLWTPRGSLLARRVILATNAYTPEGLFPHLKGRLLPALSSILVTRPLSQAEREEQGWSGSQMAFDTRELLHYFRLLPDGRFLFGGRGALRDSPRARRWAQRRLHRDFKRLFPAWEKVDIEYFWNGQIALARDLLPHIGRQPDDSTLFHALAYHGNGVAMASWAGYAIAGLLAGNPRVEQTIPAMLRRPPPKFPLPWLRRQYLRAAYLGLGLKDRWD